MLDTIRKCAKLIGPGNRSRWILVILLGMAVSALEAVGTLLVFALLAMVVAPDAALRLPVIGDISRWLPEMPQEELLLLAAGVVAAFFLVRGLFFILQLHLQYRISHRAGAQLSRELLRGYLSVPYAFHLRRNSADLIRNIYSSVQAIVSDVLVPSVRILSEALVIVAIVVVLFTQAPLATVIALASFVPFVVLMLRIILPHQKRLGGEAHRASRESLKSVQHSLQGLRDVVMLDARGFFVDEFTRSRETQARAKYIQGTLRGIPRVIIETTLVFFIFAFIGITLLLGRSLQAALPVIGLFGYAAFRTFGPLSTIINSINNLKFSTVAIDQIYEEVTQFRAHERDLSAKDGPRFQLEREIIVDRVGFQYEGSDEWVLQDVSFSIGRGESVGLAGTTGSGKTTLIDLITGLLQPTSGSVRVDDTDVRDVVDAWQRSLGVVPQVMFLLDDTLRRNIAFGAGDDEIDEERVLEAVRLAQLEEFVDSLPEGLDTRVAERGVRLSGGQRQRVAIARSLYRKPEVIVFDEGTSALDNQTERALLEALESLRGRLTMIIVAHRLTSVRRCDKVVLLERGRMVDIGTYDELVARNTDFREIASLS